MGVRGGAGGAGGGKRQRQKAAGNGDGDGGRANDDEGPETVVAAAAPALAAPLSPPTLWETVFGRDEVTGAVCNSLAMIGTRGGALLEALRPTLLQLLRHRSKRGRSGGELGNRGKKQAAAGRGGGGGGGGGDHASIVRSPDDESLAAMLQGQRAAMACVLCCWEGLDVGGGGGADSCPSSVSAPAAAAGTAKGNDNKDNDNAKSAPSPLSALERPMAAACVWAMKTAGTAEAAEKARGARLLRPVLVLVKRWPALLPLMLELIVEATAEVTTKAALSVGGEGAACVQGGAVGGVGVGGSQSLEPVLRCLQAVVRDPGLQGQLRRRHVGVLRESTGRLCVELDGSLLKGVVVQLRADVDVLCGCGGGGGVEDQMR